MTSLDVAADALRVHRPHLPVDRLVPLGEGLDNAAFVVGDLILRFAKDSDVAARAEVVEREAALLAVVAEVSPVAVPTLEFADPERGCLAYRRLPGVVLLDLPAADRARLGPSVCAVLHEVLTALHRVPPERVVHLVDMDDTSPAEWLAELAASYPGLAAHLPPARRSAVEEFLAAPAPGPVGDPQRVFSHNDLGIEHVLVDPASGAVTGVIDWSDAALVEPAPDLGRLLRDLGPAALATAGLDVDERVVFYARCTLLEDLAFGVETGRGAYRDKGLLGLEWLFATATGEPAMSSPTASRSARLGRPQPAG